MNNPCGATKPEDLCGSCSDCKDRMMRGLKEKFPTAPVDAMQLVVNAYASETPSEREVVKEQVEFIASYYSCDKCGKPIPPFDGDSMTCHRCAE